MNDLGNLLAAKPTSPLYHYTNQRGLLGIVESRSIWASSIYHLNDSAEFLYAIAMVTEILHRSLKAEHGPCNDLYGFILDDLPLFTEFDVCVASFSEEPDLLSQWRGYCAEGPGFSIGFSPEILEFQENEQDFHLRKCIYDEQVQERLCSEIVSKSCRVAWGEKDATRRRNLVWEEFLPLLMGVLPALKHPSFAEEREWRLIGGPFPYKATDYRPGKRGLVPYRNFNLSTDRGRLRFEQLIVGPTQEPRYARNAAYSFLVAKEVDCAKVENSTVTYRS